MKKILSDKYNVRQASMDDLPRIHQLEQRKSLHYHGVSGFSLARLQNEYETPGFEIEKSIHLVENQEGKLVAHAEVWDVSNPSVYPYTWMAVDPDFENRGLEPYLLDWAEKRSRQALDRVNPELRVAMRASSNHVIESSRNALLTAGLKLFRHSFRMRIEMDELPPKPVWPEKISLRPYDPEKEAYAIYEVDDEVFQDHFGYVKELPEEGYKKFMHSMTGDDSYDPSLWFLAVDGEEIAGICLCRKYGLENEDTGHISDLGVKRPWRRQGIALALLQHSFGEFYQRGKKIVDLEVDASSLTGATDLYRKAGMFVLRQFDSYEKELRPGRDVSVISLETSE